MFIKGLILLIIGLIILYYLISKINRLYETNLVALCGLYILNIIFLAFSGIAITSSIIS